MHAKQMTDEHTVTYRRAAYVDISIAFLLIPLSFMLFGGAVSVDGGVSKYTPVVGDTVSMFLILAVILFFIVSRTLCPNKVYHVVYVSRSSLPLVFSFISTLLITLLIRSILYQGAGSSMCLMFFLAMAFALCFVTGLPDFSATIDSSPLLGLLYIGSIAIVLLFGVSIVVVIGFMHTFSSGIANAALYSKYVYMLIAGLILTESLLADVLCRKVASSE